MRDNADLISTPFNVSVANASALHSQAIRIDHFAVAVVDIESSIRFYRDVLGFELMERRTTIGKKTGMLSAVMTIASFSIVLVQGTSIDSQVSRFIESYGPGVQHIAFEVADIQKVYEDLRKRGMEFSTTMISSPGLNQVFSKRDKGSGIMLEFIERGENNGFGVVSNRIRVSTRTLCAS